MKDPKVTDIAGATQIASAKLDAVSELSGSGGRTKLNNRFFVIKVE